MEWFIKTEVKTLAEIAEDSTEWGNHGNTEDFPRDFVKTGSRKNGVLIISTTLQVMWRSGHKNSKVFRIVLFVVAITTMMVAIFLSPIAITTILIATIAALTTVKLL